MSDRLALIHEWWFTDSDSPVKREVLALIAVAQAAEVVVTRSANAPWFREHYRIHDLATALSALPAREKEEE